MTLVLSWINLSSLVDPRSRIIVLWGPLTFPSVPKNMKMKTFRIWGKWKLKLPSPPWILIFLQSFWPFPFLKFRVKMDLHTPSIFFWHFFVGFQNGHLQGSCMGDMMGACTAPCTSAEVSAGDCPVASLDTSIKASPNSKGHCDCWSKSHATGVGFWRESLHQYFSGGAPRAPRPPIDVGASGRYEQRAA